MIKLLDAVSTNTNGSWFDFHPGRNMVVVQADSFDGGTVTVELTVNAGTTAHTAKQIDNSAMTATTNGVFYLATNSLGLQIRATLTGATNPSNVSVFLLGGG